MCKVVSIMFKVITSRDFYCQNKRSSYAFLSKEIVRINCFGTRSDICLSPTIEWHFAGSVKIG